MKTKTIYVYSGKAPRSFNELVDLLVRIRMMVPEGIDVDWSVDYEEIHVNYEQEMTEEEVKHELQLKYKAILKEVSYAKRELDFFLQKNPNFAPVMADAGAGGDVILPPGGLELSGPIVLAKDVTIRGST